MSLLWAFMSHTLHGHLGPKGPFIHKKIYIVARTKHATSIHRFIGFFLQMFYRFFCKPTHNIVPQRHKKHFYDYMQFIS